MRSSIFFLASAVAAFYAPRLGPVARLGGRVVTPRLLASDASADGGIDAAIDELLAERRPEQLPAILGRRLDVLGLPGGAGFFAASSRAWMSASASR